MTPDQILIAVFAYNRPRELDVCLRSIAEHCPGIRTVVYDDQSADQEVIRVIERYNFGHIKGAGKGGRHGGLYVNMNAALDLAKLEGFRYLLAVQDDMQFVRPFDIIVMAEYAAIFDGDSAITQIDPRFARNTAKVSAHPAVPAFTWNEPYFQTYSDIGLFSVERLQEHAWTFIESEKANRAKGAAHGLRRVFPFTPVSMQIPFPSIFRNRQRGRSRSRLEAGGYTFKPMSPHDIIRMDARPRFTPPWYRKYLRIVGMGTLARLRWLFMSDSKVFR